jgi:8-oxo-dGTP pyrophosphatase MutT (NUDIX family)
MPARTESASCGRRAPSDPDTGVSSSLIENMTRERLAERIANAGRYLTTHEHDVWHQYVIQPDQKVKHAAVLMPLVEREEGIQVLFTQRTTYLKDHTGQISFPGGGVEEHDRNRQETALRETEEEIGLARSAIAVLGQLPEYEMQSGFRITPVIGWIRAPYTARLDPLEVEDLFEVPLEHFLSAERYQRRRYVIDGVERKYLAIPYQGRYIWGATAGMLYLFYQLVRG